jgi:hypothetical protein
VLAQEALVISGTEPPISTSRPVRELVEEASPSAGWLNVI